MESSFMESRQPAEWPEKTPWLLFLFLTVIFFGAQHDWYFSLSAAEGFTPTVDEFTTITEQGNMLRRVVFFSLGIYALVSLSRTGDYRVKVDGSLGWLILTFLSWACLSLAWSIEPAFTFRRLVLLSMLSLGAFAVSRRFTLSEILLWVFFSAFAYLHLGLLAEIALGTFHPLSGGYRFAGTLHPNSQGINCALLFFSSLFLLRQGRRRHGLLYLAAFEALVFLLLTKSRTSLALVLFALFLYWFLSLPLSRKGGVVLGVLFVGSLLLLFGDYVFPSLQQAVTLGRSDSDAITLTGRIPLWQQELSYIAERPIQGYGYDSFWTSRHIAEIAEQQAWTVTQAHSAYLDNTLGLGLVGGVTFLLIFVVGIRRAFITHEETRNAVCGFFLVVLIFAALNGLLETIIVQPTHGTFVSMLALSWFGFSRPPAVGEKEGNQWRQ